MSVYVPSGKININLRNLTEILQMIATKYHIRNMLSTADTI